LELFDLYALTLRCVVSGWFRWVSLIGREEASLFFNVVAKRYERGSMIFTSNLPLTQWATALADDQTLTAARPGWIPPTVLFREIRDRGYTRNSNGQEVSKGCSYRRFGGQSSTIPLFFQSEEVVFSWIYLA